MDSPNDINTFNITIQILNKCIKQWFQQNLPQEYALGEFKECCTNEERDIINKSVAIFKTTLLWFAIATRIATVGKR